MDFRMTRWNTHLITTTRMTELEEVLAFSHSRSLTACIIASAFGFWCQPSRKVIISCSAVRVNQLMLLLTFKWLCWEFDDSSDWIYWESDHSLKLDISRTRGGDDSLNWIYWMQWMRNCTITPRQQQKLILSVLMFYAAKAGDSLNWIYWKQQIQKWTLILLSTIEIQSLLINSALSTA